VQWRVGVPWYLVVLFGYIAFYLLAASLAQGMAPAQSALAKWPLLFTAYLPAVLTFNLVTAVGEEPGWRGYALPHLQEKYGPVVGSFILGTLHAGWHLPVFFLPALGLGKRSPGFVAMWLPSVWGTTLVWTWIFNRTKGSILMAILLHSAFDAANTFVITRWTTLQSASAAVQQRYSIVVLSLFIGTAVLAILLTRGRLGFSGKSGSPAPEQPALAAAAR
jgi:uncharacterized protein